MKEKTYLIPLKKYLSEEIPPKQLAHLLDELPFDYSQKIIKLCSINNEPDLYVHDETISFPYHLRRLRDVLKKCRV